MEYVYAFTTMVLSIVLIFIIVEKEHENNNLIIFLVFSIFLFFYLVANRSLVGDAIGYVNYLKDFDYYKDDGVFELGFVIYTGVFYYFANEIIFLLSFPLILIITTWVLYYSVIKRHSLILFFLLIMSPTFMAYSTTGFRQTIAMSLGCISLLLYYKNYWKVAISVIVLASTFHQTALIYSLVFLSPILNKKNYLLFWFLSIIVGQVELLSFIGDYIIFSDYNAYFSSEFGTTYKTGIRLDFILFSMMPIVVMELNSRGKEEGGMFLYFSYIILNSVANSLSFIPYIDRIYSFSWLLIPLILSERFFYLNKYMKIGCYLCFLTLFVFYNRFWLAL